MHTHDDGAPRRRLTLSKETLRDLEPSRAETLAVRGAGDTQMKEACDLVDEATRKLPVGGGGTIITGGACPDGGAPDFIMDDEVMDDRIRDIDDVQRIREVDEIEDISEIDTALDADDMVRKVRPDLDDIRRLRPDGDR